MAVRIGDVGLDIVDGGAVHQVGTAHDEHRPNVRALLNSFQLYAGKPQRVRSEGGAGGKHAHPGVAAKARRAHGGRPAFPHRAGKLPHQPDMTEILQPAQGVGVAVFRGETISPRSSSTSPLWRGMPNLVGKAVWIWAMTFRVMASGACCMMNSLLNRSFQWGSRRGCRTGCGRPAIPAGCGSAVPR